ncbi:MAG: HAMP domain-containing sensor histidine kinase [Acidobacteria bacterium]|nr:HAMP domain-containing sensor histidine kinase [Acidobacteriota bacterium]
MRLGNWFRPPQYLLALFLTVTLVPGVALVWLGARLLQQDRDLERQQIQERIERAAGAIAAGLAHELDGIRDRLPALLASPPIELARDGAVAVAFDAKGVSRRAGAPLLYVPVAIADAGPPADEWHAGETEEYRNANPERASAIFRSLASSPDPRVRAGSLVRLARTLRKLHREDEALVVYEQLGTLGAVQVAGEAADLVARQERCALLSELRRLPELEREAAALLTVLESGQWPLDRAEFLFQWEHAQRWLGSRVTGGGAEPGGLEHRREGLALAASVEMAWAEWRDSGRTVSSWAGRRSAWLDGQAVLLVWRGGPDGAMVLAASSRYLSANWQSIWQTQHARVSLVDDAGHQVLRADAAAAGPVAVRMAQDTRLPWAIRVASADSRLEMADIAGRRQLLLVGLALLGFLVVAGSLIVARAVHKELAVARLQADFVSAVSHEFRTPLTSMSHLTDLLRTGRTVDEARRQQYYEVFARETERLQHFVETLLDFGRIEAGAQRYTLEPADPVVVVSHIVEQFRATPEAVRHPIEIDAGGTLPSVQIDADAFGHALSNLIDNAAKYSPDEAPIHVVVEREGTRVAVRVRDQGSGIPASERRRIFQKFVRGAAARKSGVKGTGVGLAMARQIVRAHHGDIRVDSEPDRGSTFTILLPAAGQWGQTPFPKRRSPQ